jgi:hypothetical protein
VEQQFLLKEEEDGGYVFCLNIVLSLTATIWPKMQAFSYLHPRYVFVLSSKTEQGKSFA